MEGSTKAIVREAKTGSDHALIYSTWRNALWFAEKRDSKEADQFYKDASEKIAHTLRQPGVKVSVACLADEPDMLLGWAVMLGTHLEFVYVKIDYRRKGIGRFLTKGFKTFADPQTKIGKSLVEKFQKEKNGREEKSQDKPD